MIDKTFIIPTVTNVDGAVRTIETIYKYTKDFRIILIDNSDENNYDKFKDTVHIYLKPYYNLGFAKSMNEGIRLADTEWLILCNDDVEFIHKDWWENAIKHFETQKVKGGKPIAGVQIASIMDRNAEPRLPYKEEYTQEDWDKLVDWTDDTGVYGNAHLRDIVTESACMWCTITKREVIDEVGMFDEKFYPGGGEDYDWSRRVYMKNFRLIGVYDSWAVHHWGQTKDKYKQLTGLPVREELIWNGFEEKWGKGADVYGNEGRTMTYPKDNKRIQPL